MKYREFGKENEKVLIFLHGGGLSWWNYRDQASILEKDYHVIIPILDGHSGSDSHFTSIEDNARQIIEFIDTKFNGSVLLIGGLSLGAQILLEILSQRKDICSYALVESALVIPSALTGKLLGPSVSLSYGLINKPSFAKAQFKSLRIREELFEDYYRDSCAIQKEDLTAFLKANSTYSLKASLKQTNAAVHIFVGAKDNVNVIRSSKMIHALLPSSTLKFLPDYYHGEFSLNHPEQYAETIQKILG